MPDGERRRRVSTDVAYGPGSSVVNAGLRRLFWVLTHERGAYARRTFAYLHCYSFDDSKRVLYGTPHCFRYRLDFPRNVGFHHRFDINAPFHICFVDNHFEIVGLNLHIPVHFTLKVLNISELPIFLVFCVENKRA